MQISPRIFEKIRIDSHAIFRGLGEDYLFKRSDAKNLPTLSLSGSRVLHPDSPELLHDLPMTSSIVMFSSFPLIKKTIFKKKMTS